VRAGARARAAFARLLRTSHSHRGCAGSRGFTGLRRFLVGSVSSNVVEMELAPCLVVRSSLPRHAACGAEGGDIAAATARDEAGPAETPAAAARGRVVGIAVDGTPAGAALVQWCRQFLLRPSDSVSVLHGRPEKPKARAAARRACAVVQSAAAAVAAAAAPSRSPLGAASGAH
jgi:nucleotide-binding universal stress UspA family protein